jgi:hypothetical protein
MTFAASPRAWQKRGMAGRATIEVPGTIATAYRYLVSHRRTVMRVGFVLFVVVAALSLMADGFDAVASEATDAVQLVFFTAMSLVRAFVSIATATTLATAILWDAKPSTWFALRVGWIEVQIFLLSVAMVALNTTVSTLVAPPAEPPATLTTEGGLMLLIGLASTAAIIFLSVRLSLVVPYSIASGRFDLRGIWEITYGNFWPLLLLFLLAFLPIVLLAFFIDAMIQHLRQFYASYSFVAPFLSVLSAAANGAVQVVIVSLATALACFSFLTIAPKPIHIVHSRED